MKKNLRIGNIAAVALLSCAAAFALAQDKGAALKVETRTLLENDRVLVIENHFKPGAENTNVPRTARVVRYMTSGTLLRTFPDGKKEELHLKAGEVRFNPAVTGDVKQYTTKNIGKEEIVIMIVVLK